MDKGGVSLASKASLATDFPVGSLAGSGYAGCGGTANGHAGTKPFAAAGGSVLLDWIGSGSSAELGRAGADVAYVAGIAPGVRGSGGRTKRETQPRPAFFGFFPPSGWGVGGSVDKNALSIQHAPAASDSPAPQRYHFTHPRNAHAPCWQSSGAGNAVDAANAHEVGPLSATRHLRADTNEPAAAGPTLSISAGTAALAAPLHPGDAEPLRAPFLLSST